jgi:phospholipid/cholesterol/gamma-HCH transport system permease protein
MSPDDPQLRIEGDVIRLRGHWIATRLNRVESRLAPRALPSAAELTLDLSGVARLDTAGAWLIQRLLADRRGAGRKIDTHGASEHVAAMLELVAAQTDPREAPATRKHPGLLEKIGRESVTVLNIGYEFLSFVGEGTMTTLRAFAVPRRLRPRMLLKTIEQAGVNALPIVGLLSFLIGVVIAYQSAVFLRQYGANVFLADLVGISMARELAPLMTAIIVAGRTGSAFTAQIGTMMVTDEVDAIRAMGIRPLEVLVTPKMLGLIVALPLLTLFADAMGVLGGMVIGRTVLDISAAAFLDRLAQAVSVSSYLVGLAKAPIFAAVIAAVGCYQGFKVRGSAESVGQRTTMSVVQSIFLVIVLDAVFSVLFNRLGI